MFKKTILGVLALAAFALGGATVQAADEYPHTDQQDWSFAGVFGTYDQNQLRRGFQVYREVCSSCHPFYTGKSAKLSDRKGRIERFRRRYSRG